MKKRVLYLSAKEVKIGHLPGHVVIQFDLAEQSAGLVPELDLAIRLDPAESRSFARQLLQTADEAEGV